MQAFLTTTEVLSDHLESFGLLYPLPRKVYRRPNSKMPVVEASLVAWRGEDQTDEHLLGSSGFLVQGRRDDIQSELVIRRHLAAAAVHVTEGWSNL
jgi:hypothetical protein